MGRKAKVPYENNSHNKFKSHNSKEIKIMDQWKVFGELLNLRCII